MIFTLINFTLSFFVKSPVTYVFTILFDFVNLFFIIVLVAGIAAIKKEGKQ